MATYHNDGQLTGFFRGIGAITLTVGCLSASENCALAQSNIVPDHTLGAESSFVVPNFNGLPVEAIGGGAVRGQNLFHSFQEFNVSDGRGAYFFSPNAAIQNILARVTGSNRSEILGTLGTFGDSTPNLFLINPNGIIFGEGAKLDVGGSFVATTANAVRLGETGLFSASEPGTSTLLAINPNAFFFNQLSNPAEIVNRSTATTPVLGDFVNGLPFLSGLQVPEGRSLLLLGGDVRLEGGFLQTLGGRVEVGGLSAPGIVGLNVDGNILSLSFPDGVARADVSLTNRARVDAAAGGGGSIAINAQTVELLGRSVVFTGILPGLGSVDSQAGDIEINATGVITVSELSAIANQVFGIGKGGDIEITTNSLSLTDGADLSASTFGRGDAGNVRIRASEISLAGVGSNGLSSGAGSTVEQGAEGKGGNVEIFTNFLSLTDGAALNVSTFGQGDAGNVRIRASKISLAGVGSNRVSSGAYSTVALGAEGKGGNVEISTNSLWVTDGARLDASTGGQGDAGNVRITATDTISFTGVGSNGFPGGAGSVVAQGAEGKGGNVEITAHSLSVSDGAVLTASTFGQGDAGNVRITATDTVSFAGVGSDGLSSAAYSSVEPGAEGKGGDVEITSHSLSVSDGAQLDASTLGRGDAGNVRITATDTISFTGVGSNGLSSGAGSTVHQGAEGKGGDVEITSHSLSVSDGAQLAVGTFGQGDAGNVRITATDTVSFTGVGSHGFPSGAFSGVAQGAGGKGGDVEITSHSLSVSDGAALAANTFGQGDAGNLRITATDTVSFAGVSSNGRSSAAGSSVEQGAEGKGGNIEIISHSLSVSDGAQLVAVTRGRGDAGNVRITATDTVSFGVGSNGLSGAAFSSVQSGAEGKGGDIEITTGSLSLTDAFISSQSGGIGVAGDIIIETRQNLELDRSNISATTQADDGGNIRLRVGDLLLMRNDSNISTTAGQAGAGGDGGNITINADFVVAVPKEDSDITANAFNGRGGNINITTQGIYGLTFRKQDIPSSSDITASSQFGVDGEFQLDLLTDVDPSQGLGELPANLVDATGLIDRRCTPTDNARGSRFIITGRGGLPRSPNDVLQNEEAIVNWITLNSQEDSTNPVPPEANPTNTAPKRLVEAQSWVYSPNGEVILTAEAPTATPHRSWQTSPSCEDLLQ